MTSKYRLIWQLMEGERVLYFAAVAALIIASCFLYLVPLVSSAVLDSVIQADSQNLSPLSLRVVGWIGGRELLQANLWIVLIVITGLTGIAGIFTYLRGRWTALATERVIGRVRDRLYDQIQHLPCSFHDTAQTGDMVQRCTSDMETLRQFLASQVVEIGRAVLMLLIPLPLMFYFDVRMTVLSLLLIPPIVVFSVVFFRRVRTRFEEVDKAEGRMTSTLQENLVGIRTVRAFARQEFEIEKFGLRNREHRDLHLGLYRLLAAYWSASDLLCGVQIALVVIVGGMRLLDGTLAVGGFFFFLSAVNMFLWPVRMMGRILTELGKATVAIGRIQEILGHPRESLTWGRKTNLGTAPDVPKYGTPAAVPSRGEITFDDVTFCHRQDKPALENVSFRIAPGTTVGLLGPSGSGKSTIVHLLLRFYDPEKGVIKIDGRDIATIDRARLRKDIPVVMQEPFLYSKTIRENIALGHSTAARPAIVDSAGTACVHDTIAGLEHGYETLVGERGITLSGGQRQRVALARALLRQSPVLILDDALSAVDTGTEGRILRAMRKRRGRHTTIIIAHRLSTIMDADEILVLDQGRIVQRGNHAELKAEDGLYRRIWSIQQGLEDQLRHDLGVR